MRLVWFSYLALALPEGELPGERGAGLPPPLVLLAVDLVQRRRERRLRLGQRHTRLGRRVRGPLLGAHGLLRWEIGSLHELILPLFSVQGDPSARGMGYVDSVLFQDNLQMRWN